MLSVRAFLDLEARRREATGVLSDRSSLAGLNELRRSAAAGSASPQARKESPYGLIRSFGIFASFGIQ